MKIVRTPQAMQAEALRLRSEGKRVGFVPTMGALHEGHLRLVDACREQAEVVVVSIFINPTQFGPGEDFEKYPRNHEADARLLEERGANLLFLPEKDAIYPPGYSTFINEETLSTGLCGRSRPGHFRGVCTVVAILLNLVQPQVAVFGEKDAQQLAIIRKMVKDLCLPVEIASLPTVREADGLARSSRNQYLSTAERAEALRLPKALQAAQEHVARGQHDASALLHAVESALCQSPAITIDYLSLVDRESLQAVETITAGQCLLAAAIKIGQTRLIDNVKL